MKKTDMGECVNIYRGDILLVDLGEQPEESHVQAGCRPVVVIQNNRGNEVSPCLIVAPITSRHKNFLPTHARLSGRFDGRMTGNTVLLEQLVTINKYQVVHKIDSVSDRDMREIERALLCSLALPARADNKGAVAKG
ncbi:type II toxin-antitoxin system PemK/MazF family toxin [Paenibacillus albicereus]|uniref:Type II toxin-antitoxin system PemK/MazF family toxin n=1 Tax=Paenibacillus albicereus TaxID=2726185 RepID=A0A6H2GZY4_9BACL|nr:type II toxin-antitoxin system PemK/MazF family toxin [Paenibacillus albicereus]QJC52726.1 type II toxin-antitoxin system PemK/MazF family toxin [Paenibacillus albicereus]